MRLSKIMDDKWRSACNDVDHHNHISGIKKTLHKSYHDIIRENSNITFEVVHAPISILLYKKLLGLSSNDVDDYNTDEICAVLKHISLFDEYIKGSIAYEVFKYLQDNQKLFEDIASCRDSPDDIWYTSQIKLLNTCIFGSGTEAFQFRQAVQSYISIRLTDTDDTFERVSAKSSICAFVFWCDHTQFFTCILVRQIRSKLWMAKE